MASGAVDADFKIALAAHQRPLVTDNSAGLHGRPVVDPETEIRMDQIKQPGLYHYTCTGCSLLRRLENQVYSIFEKAVLFGALQQEGRPQQGGRMEIVAAGMHDTGNLRLPGALILLSLRQCVDIRPKHDLRTLFLSLLSADLRRDACSRLCLQGQDTEIRQSLQKSPDLCGRPHLFSRELGMHVQISFKSQDPLEFLLGQLIVFHRFLHLPSPAGPSNA